MYKEIFIIGGMLLMSLLTMLVLLMLSTMFPFRVSDEYKCTCNNAYQAPIEE